MKVTRKGSSTIQLTVSAALYQTKCYVHLLHILLSTSPLQVWIYFIKSFNKYFNVISDRRMKLLEHEAHFRGTVCWGSLKESDFVNIWFIYRNNIKKNLVEIRFKVLDCIHVAQDRKYLRIVVNTVKNFVFLKFRTSSWVAEVLRASQEFCSLLVSWLCRVDRDKSMSFRNVKLYLILE